MPTNARSRKSSASRSGSPKKKTGSRGGAKSRASKAPKITNYREAQEWLFDRVDVEMTRPSRVTPDAFKLDRIRKLMHALGDPQDTLQIAHIAGTNGKGSVSAMVSACLRGCGCAVGVYSSPHLTDLRERIQINGQVISHPRFVDGMRRLAEAADKIPAKWGTPTFFELMTALALLDFAEQAVDVAIVEVGLGGRLEATNIVKPAVTAVTQIGRDHESFLGETLGDIAREKGGIFKSGVPAITFKQPGEVIESLKKCAEEAGTSLSIVGKDIEFSCRFESTPRFGPQTRVGVFAEHSEFEHVPVPLHGEHQAWNCGLALAIVDRLRGSGFELDDQKIMEGLASTELPGRMELIRKEPRVYVDGAHNPQALAALVRSIGAYVTYDSMITIYGCSADKDVEECLRQISVGADKLIFTRAKGNPRAADPNDLARRFAEVSGKMCQVAETLEDAVSIALRGASRDDVICITGSFYLAGEAKKLAAKSAAARAAHG
ncbi:MAG: folylpolyglutamate synthase/dihydrofolate synthase family protein [Planctomycetota bacterium]